MFPSYVPFVRLTNALIRATSAWAETVQLGELNDPNSPVCIAASLLPRSASSSVKYSPAIVRSAVDFSDALRSFENQAAIGLRPWSKDSGHHREEPARANGARVFGIVGAEVG
jgi:hypothetical protein